MISVIVFEGMPGSGKTVHISFLRDYFLKEGYRVTVNSTDNDNELIKTVKGVVRKLPPDSIEQKLYMWILHQMQDVILTKLVDSENYSADNNIVFVDRFWGSLAAYSSYYLKRTFTPKFWTDIGRIFQTPVSKTIFLDILYGVSVQRKKSNIRTKDQFQAIRSFYLELAAKYKWIIVDNSRDLSRVNKELIELCTQIVEMTLTNNLCKGIPS